MQERGHQADLVYGEFDESLFGRRRGDPDGDFALTGDRQFGELAGLVSELLFVRRVQKNEFECLEVFVLGFDGDVVDTNGVWQIGIMHVGPPSLINRAGLAGCGETVHHRGDATDVDVDRAQAHATAAAHALDPPVVFVDEIFEFVHEALAHPMQLGPAGIVAGTVQGEERVHAAVPVFQAYP
jgi:hypothetical protein